ncbi:MAG: hypothetical protein HYR56_28405 [Acidobacteria bacterium]|nr:hypothetical protein [Acidobacteriota bacterium]MBI3421424.1 hypothetical protein [Acidobacteriota bacterium]
MNNKLRRLAVIVLGLALCSFGAPLPSPTFAGTAPKAIAEKGDETNLKGQLTVNGSVTLNGKRAITGTTVLSDSRISVACTSGNSATVNLGKLGHIELSPGAQMVVRFSDGLISGELLTGNAVVNNTAGVKVAITTPAGMSGADGKEPATLAVNSQKGSRCNPLVAKGSGGGGGGSLGAGAIAALLAGAGGAAIATGVAVSQKDFPASVTLP